MQRLNIWMNGIPVGYWEKGREEILAYFDDWVNHEQGRALSLSLPFSPGNAPHKGELVANYFDNLLPDSIEIRRRLSQRYKKTGTSAFELLSALGRDCVGAIQLLPPNEVPVDLRTIQGEILKESDIAQHLRATTSAPVLGLHLDEADLRLSIAGAQEKTALLWHENHWKLPKGSTPTTHIFKLPMGLVGNMRADMSTSVENEWLCSKITDFYGLPTASCDMATFEDQKVLIVERFDRRFSSNKTWLLRLPQEDMCQATGTSPSNKYQSDGGPGIERIVDILLSSESAKTDQRNFFKTQIVFWLLAATDGHAKNFSIAQLPRGNFRSTPLYDVLSAHPVVGRGASEIAPQKVKLAMAVRASKPYYHLNQIQRRHWSAQAKQVGLGGALAEELITELIEQTDTVIEQASQLLPDDFPAQVAERIFEGLRSQRDKLVLMGAD